MKTTQYTIRGISERLDQVARQKARKTHQSLNTVLKQALIKGMGLSDMPAVYHDLDGLIGTWVKDPEFDKAMKSFDVIDKKMWE